MNELLAEIENDLIFKQQLSLSEHNIYGSSRLGVKRDTTQLHFSRFTASSIDTITGAIVKDSILYQSTAQIDSLSSQRVLGYKQYELSNHLGNVLAVISDKRIYLVDTTISGDTFALWDAHITSAQDYYPFGMLMPNRHWVESDSSAYMYGFNGMERDDEWNGTGNAYDFGARIYDSRLGRWLAVDLRDELYPMFSPNIGFGNNPNFYIDPGGETLYVSKQFMNTYYYPVLKKMIEIGEEIAFLKAHFVPFLGDNKDINVRMFSFYEHDDTELVGGFAAGFTASNCSYIAFNSTMVFHTKYCDECGVYNRSEYKAYTISELGVALNIAHEFLHTSLEGGGDVEHETMSKKHLKSLQNFILDYAKESGITVNDEEVIYLVWIGLEGTNEWVNKFGENPTIENPNPTWTDEQKAERQKYIKAVQNYYYDREVRTFDTDELFKTINLTPENSSDDYTPQG